MKRKSKLTIAIAAAALAALGAAAVYAQDKYSLKSPSGIAFSDFGVSRISLKKNGARPRISCVSQAPVPASEAEAAGLPWEMA